MAHRIAEPKVERKPLRVLQRGDAMVPDYQALMNRAGSTRRFLGLKHDPSQGPSFVDPVDNQTKNSGGFVKLLDTPVTVEPDNPHYTEYVKHLRDGDLWAADQDTANEAGVLFEPDFGGEHEKWAAGDEAAKVRKDRADAAKRNTEAAKKAEADAKSVKPATATTSVQPAAPVKE